MKPFVWAAALCLSASFSKHATSQVHSFSVRDDIAMTRFSVPHADPRVPGSEMVAPSPDRRHFAIVTTRGLLEQDRVESEISIFDATEIAVYLRQSDDRLPHRRVLAWIVSWPHHEEAMAYAPVIKDLRWSADGASLSFKGEGIDGKYRLYVAPLDGRGFHALTEASQSVGRYDLVGNTIVYASSNDDHGDGMSADSINADAQVATGHRIHEVIFPTQLKRVAPESFELNVLHLSPHGLPTTAMCPILSFARYPTCPISFLSAFPQRETFSCD